MNNKETDTGRRPVMTANDTLTLGISELLHDVPIPALKSQTDNGSTSAAMSAAIAANPYQGDTAGENTSLHEPAFDAAMREFDIVASINSTIPDRKDYFKAIQKWVGHVVGVDAETFQAHLTPVIGEGPDQYAEIYLSEVDDSDKGLIVPGAMFYWSIGYHETPSGRRNESVIRFRRLLAPSEMDMKQAEAEAKKWLELFDES